MMWWIRDRQKWDGYVPKGCASEPWHPIHTEWCKIPPKRRWRDTSLLHFWAITHRYHGELRKESYPAQEKAPFLPVGGFLLHSHVPDEHRHDAEHRATHPDLEAVDRGHAVPLFKSLLAIHWWFGLFLKATTGISTRALSKARSKRGHSGCHILTLARIAGALGRTNGDVWKAPTRSFNIFKLSDKARERHRPENNAAVRRRRRRRRRKDWEAGTFRRLVTRFERLWVHLIQLN